MNFDFVFDDRDLHNSSFFFVLNLLLSTNTSINVASITTNDISELSTSFLFRIITSFTIIAKNQIVFEHHHYLHENENIVQFVKNISQIIVTNARNNKFDISKMMNTIRFKRVRRADDAKSFRKKRSINKSLFLIMSHQTIIFVSENVSQSFSIAYSQNLNQLFDE